MGYDVIYFPHYYLLEDTKEHIKLIEKINEYLEDSEHEHVLIGHSFGGIIAYSLSEKAYAKINKIITIGAPHRVPFNWFLEILAQLPYKKKVNVKDQFSFGLFFDKTVPFLFTKHKSSKSHKVIFAKHNYILGDSSFLKKVL